MSTTTTTGRIDIASPQLGEREQRRVADVISSGYIACGPEVETFQSEFASFCDVDYGVATSNGTTALHAALVGLDVGPGDRVITTPFSFIATANAAQLAGADVDFVDIDPETYNIDPVALEAALRAGDPVDCVIAVHLFGLAADMDYLSELADQYDFALLEDAAQAHGATYQGRRVGGLGDAACFSFYPTKNMTTGEGGMITTDDPAVADRAARFIDHGRVGHYEHATVGHNFRMTDIAAAIGRVQLDRLPSFNARRRTNARRLSEALDGTPLTVPSEPGGSEHVYHQYTIQTDDRDSLAAALETADVGTGVYYPTPLHKQAPYRHLGTTAPVAERVADRVLSLPVHPGLEPADVDRVAASVRAALGVSA